MKQKIEKTLVKEDQNIEGVLKSLIIRFTNSFSNQ